MPRTKKDTAGVPFVGWKMPREAKKRTISQSPVVSEAPSLPQRKLYHQKALGLLDNGLRQPKISKFYRREESCMSSRILKSQPGIPERSPSRATWKEWGGQSVPCKTQRWGYLSLT